MILATAKLRKATTKEGRTFRYLIVVSARGKEVGRYHLKTAEAYRLGFKRIKEAGRDQVVEGIWYPGPGKFDA